MSRGTLRIYLGAAPGVGKTYRMLGEGVRRHQRGTDLVVGFVETHGREHTESQLRDLEVVAPRIVEYRGATLRELDVAAVLARRPRVVLVDEFAHSNAPGSKNAKRWKDVEELLAAGIDVITTLNIQHLESLKDVIASITGVVPVETVPDEVVRGAEQLELVDMTPEAIRRRLAHGNIYPAEQIDAATANYFRPANLAALREVALLWLADRVEESLQHDPDVRGADRPWETRERVVVGITGRGGGETLIRRVARMAGRIGGDLIGVHVSADDGLTHVAPTTLAAQRELVGELGGTVLDVVGHDAAEALVAVARREKATQIVLGASRRGRWHELIHGSFITRVTRLAEGIDVHVIASDEEATAPPNRSDRVSTPIDRRRTVAAWLLTVAGLPLLVVALLPLREHVAISTVLLLVLALVLAIAAIGGRAVAVVAAIAGSLLVNWFFVPPYHTLSIAETENLIALVVFVGVAVTVGSLVVLASSRAHAARRAQLEAEALARSMSSLAADPDPVPALMEQVIGTFELSGLRIRRGADASSVIASAGDVSGPPSAALTLSSPTPDAPIVEAYGRPLSGEDARLLRALGDQLAIALDRQRLAGEAADAEKLGEVDAMRTALLRAVSHDLRTPLSSIKVMVSGLRDPTVCWTADQLAEALATIDEETDRLNRLVGNLLDASRLQVGALAVDIRPNSVAAIVASSLQSLGISQDGLVLDLPSHDPPVLCDQTLLERSLANVIGNAVRHSAPGTPVRIEAGVVEERLHLRVVDRGPGIAPVDRARITQPFQRLGDERASDGVGLGLSIAQGFVDAMGGTFGLDDTPGGGLTVTITLPLAHEAAA